MSFAAQARDLCPESAEHHDNVWFCMTCKAIERRLGPIGETLQQVLLDADLCVTIDYSDLITLKDSE